MKNSLFSLLLFVAVAKGRVIITGSGSTGGFSIDDVSLYINQFQY